MNACHTSRYRASYGIWRAVTLYRVSQIMYSSPLRLLLILTEFPPSFGGMQTHAVYLCRYLHQLGYHIEVATYRGPEVEFPFPVHRCLSRIGFTENLHALESLARIARPDLLYSSTIF